MGANPAAAKGNDIPENSKLPEEPVIDGVTYTTIQEGLAKILLPKTSTDRQVFYNPIQQFNRDLTIAVIKGFGEVYQNERREKKKHQRGGRKNKKVKREGIAVADTDRVSAQAASEGKKGGDGDEDVDMERDEQEVEARTEEVTTTIDSTTTTITDQATNTTEEGLARKDSEAAAKPKPRFAVLDALSASGLRALRYALEIPIVTTITANDMDAKATEAISRNISYNDLDPTVKPNIGNAIGHMYHVAYPLISPPASTPQIGKFRPDPADSIKYHVIDLDPYGTASPFLDAAVQAVEDGGLLAVTCTDAGVFASTSYPEKCFSLYGGLPVKGDYSHEVGVRLVLYAIATAAGKYGLTMEPLISLSIDFYIRVFVRIRKSPETVKLLASKSMLVYACGEGCGSWATQKLGTAKSKKAGHQNWKYGIALGPSQDGQCCQYCGFKTHIAGPMYSAAMHSERFITHLLSNVIPDLDPATYKTIPRINGMLQTALSELFIPEPPSTSTETAAPRTVSSSDNDPPHFFFMSTRLSKVLGCESPSLANLRSALLSLNYTVTRSHCKPGSIKSNAPWSAIWGIMRQWVKLNPVKEGKVTQLMSGWKLLHGHDDETGFESVVFDEKLGKEEKPAKGVVRYQLNPTKGWGPMSRPKPVKKTKGEKADVEGQVVIDVEEESVGSNKRKSPDEDECEGQDDRPTKKQKTPEDRESGLMQVDEEPGTEDAKKE